MLLLGLCVCVRGCVGVCICARVFACVHVCKAEGGGRWLQQVFQPLIHVFKTTATPYWDRIFISTVL